MQIESQSAFAAAQATNAPRVYSYTRFSTPEQMEGDSQRRQSAGALRWIERKNAERKSSGLPPLVLDERLSLQDLGVSAFRGSNANADKGLGGFLVACREGLIPEGSYLIVESLDRVSRMTPRKVSRLLDDIVDAGVVIATLGDGQEYDSDRLDSDPTALLIALMVSWRAHEESKVKAERLSEVWEEKRRQVRAGEAQRLTRKGPSWLEPEGEGWAERQPHADTVRRVFRMTLEGVGEHRIARTFNEEGVPIMGGGKMWHRSTVSKLLRNSAVVGTLVPGRVDYSSGRKLRVSEEPIPDIFPAVISRFDWEAVQLLKDQQTPAPRGKAATGALANVFAGLARCPECGATMTRVMKGSGPKAGKPKLVCTKAKAGAASHRYRSVPLDVLQRAALGKWQHLLIDIPAGQGGGDLDGEIDNLNAVIDVTIDQLQEMAEVNRKLPSRELAARHRALKASLASYQSDLRALERERVAADHGLIAARAEAFGDLMEQDASNLSKVNAALRTLFAGVVVDYERGVLRFLWRQGGMVEIRYASLSPISS
ncbi:recombinase family protein [Alteriqipengyuania lutimaris]|uniref:Recombinase family protein n=1 Tax=Alteriqipengyuania lutimaris TaxID=1538146 RepID=A0A395LJD1_9SPHN|nr:recombinase family protein [Alteriqipengyuania lutimaris]MBB3034742.1 DNA invertase Pin-like site-specific DNA recombinase [Alteriqipengyuania lutimaris]RDS76407.1 recombinase family protein [Alteriqipengyuania lutimaris]